LKYFAEEIFANKSQNRENKFAFEIGKLFREKHYKHRTFV